MLLCVRSRKPFKHSETGYVSVFPHIFQLESKKVPQLFFALGKKFLIDSLFWNSKLITQRITNMFAHLHISTCNSGYLVKFVDTSQILRNRQKTHQV